MKAEENMTEVLVIKGIEYSDEWQCQLFGLDDQVVLTPRKGKVPNWFWRKMQYLCFGNKWIRR